MTHAPQQDLFDNSVKKTAIISQCEKYRYSLTRQWDDQKPWCMFLMLNPSKADAFKNDNTITRCINFAQKWGYGGIKVGNLFAYRSTEPANLLQVYDPIGPDNKIYLQEMINSSEIVVLAHGNNSIVKRLSKLFHDFFPSIPEEKKRYLKLSKSGCPWHPLYIKGDTLPNKF